MRFLKSLGLLSLFAIAITLTVGCGDKEKTDDKADNNSANKVADEDSDNKMTQVSFDVEGMT